MKHHIRIFVILATIMLLVGTNASAILAAPVQDTVQTTYVIYPDDLQSWGFYTDSGSPGSYSFMPGPGTPPMGAGSIQLQIAGVEDGYIVYKSAWSGLLLSDITSLTYATYQDPSSPGDETQLPALVINIDYNLDPAWQGRLIYEPYLTPGNTPQKGVWQTWDALSGYWWADDAPGNTVCPKEDPCLLSELLGFYPNTRVSLVIPGIGFKIGNGWENGFIGNVDRFVIGDSANTDTYDFEPRPPLELTDLDLWQTTDPVSGPWVEVPGTYAGGFNTLLDPAIEWYYLDTHSLTANRPLQDGLYPFYFQSYPTGFFDYWAALGVVAGATGGQGVMWEIINGNQPICYLEVNGTDYMLVDGLTKLTSGEEAPLRIDGTYLPGAYTIGGSVADALGLTDDVALNITFNKVKPVINSLSRFSIKSGSAGFTLTITGTGFYATSVVRWNEVDLTTSYISPTSLAVNLPADLLVSLTPQTIEITVYNSGPGGGSSNVVNFEIIPVYTYLPIIQN